MKFTKKQIIKRIKNHNQTMLKIYFKEKELEKNLSFDTAYVLAEQISIDKETETEAFVNDMKSYLTEKGYGNVVYDGKTLDKLSIDELVKLCNII